MKKFIPLSVFLLLVFSGFGQDWGQMVKTADRLFNDGKYADAAEYYEKAWRTKTQRRDLIFKAGECYYWTKNYRKAAECYGFVKRDNEDFELVGLKYARSLKQDGRYREAMEEFKWFARDYKGAGKEQLDKIMVNDIKGCEMGIELATARQPKDLPVELVHLPEWVNSPENEFAPLPFSDDLLYFSSLVGGRGRLFRTSREDGKWQTPAVPQGLPEIKSEHFGNGSFSPDGTRFYFTQCSAANPDLVNGSGLRAACEIYVIRKTATGWDAPERLRDYINLPGSTNTQPFVVHERGQETLFFASDREGTFGGLDIYACSRPLESDEFDFSLPQNLGEKINTGGDEITPFFEVQTQTLYFSSNGLVSLGGMDIFQSIRTNNTWTRPENLGVPYNSTTDDFFFILKKSGNGGFFVSNRFWGNEKMTTTNEDIFEFFPKENKLFITGKIFSSLDGSSMDESSIALFENMSGEEPRLLQARLSPDGTFKFPIFPDRNYSLEISKDNFQTVNLPMSNQFAAPTGYDVSVSMLPLIKKTDAATGNDFLATGENVVFKIQLEAMPVLLENDPRYNPVRGKGQLSAEFLTGRNVQRIMLGDFLDKKMANDLARDLRNSGAFPQAFVVRYAGGARQ